MGDLPFVELRGFSLFSLQEASPGKEPPQRQSLIKEAPLHDRSDGQSSFKEGVSNLIVPFKRAKPGLIHRNSGFSLSMISIKIKIPYSPLMWELLHLCGFKIGELYSGFLF